MFDEWFKQASLNEKLAALTIDKTDFVGQFFEQLAEEMNIDLPDLQAKNDSILGKKLREQWESYCEENLPDDEDSYEESAWKDDEEEEAPSDPEEE